MIRFYSKWLSVIHISIYNSLSSDISYMTNKNYIRPFQTCSSSENYYKNLMPILQTNVQNWLQRNKNRMLPSDSYMPNLYFQIWYHIVEFQTTYILYVGPFFLNPVQTTVGPYVWQRRASFHCLWFCLINLHIYSYLVTRYLILYLP